MTTIDLLVADSHEMVRRGLCLALERGSGLAVVAEADEVGQAVEKVEQHHPQVVLVDMHLPGGGGAEACSQITACCPGTAVLVLSAFDWDIYLAQALAAGAAGFIVKEAGTAELIRAVRTVAQGGRAFTASQLQRVRTWQREVGAKLEALTPRQLEVLPLVARGRSNAEIAQALVISVKTVESHVSGILAKLDVSSRRDVIRWARRTHVLDAIKTVSGRKPGQIKDK